MLVLLLVGLFFLVQHPAFPSAISCPTVHSQLRHSPASLQRFILASVTILVNVLRRRTLAHQEETLLSTQSEDILLTPPLSTPSFYYEEAEV